MQRNFETQRLRGSILIEKQSKARAILLQVWCDPAALVSSGNWLEMQILSPLPSQTSYILTRSLGYLHTYQRLRSTGVEDLLMWGFAPKICFGGQNQPFKAFLAYYLLHSLYL